jgi:hypothetical protein
MLFHELFTASNPKNLFGNHDWYIEWLGMVDRLYPAWCSDLRIPPLATSNGNDIKTIANVSLIMVSKRSEHVR